MRIKLASSFMLAMALMATVVVPSLAEGSTLSSIVSFPLKVTGSAVSTVVGVPEGMYKDSVVGAVKATEWTSGKLGSDKNTYHTIAGALVGGPFGIVGGGAFGAFDGAFHGMKAGYEKPFSHDAFTYKDEK